MGLRKHMSLKPNIHALLQAYALRRRMERAVAGICTRENYRFAKTDRTFKNCSYNCSIVVMRVWVCKGWVGA
jgi:hypothetical protein